jgi:hypothetical protein
MVSNFKGHAPRPMPLNDERHESPLDLNVALLVKHEKLVERKLHHSLEFEPIIKPWH